MVNLTTENFSTEVKDTLSLVLVDFWADWCTPCKAIEPIILELADDYEDRVKFCRVNVDDQEELAKVYGVTAVPTVLIFKSGNIVERVVGFRNERDLKANLDKFLVD